RISKQANVLVDYLGMEACKTINKLHCYEDCSSFTTASCPFNAANHHLLWVLFEPIAKVPPTCKGTGATKARCIQPRLLLFELPLRRHSRYEYRWEDTWRSDFV